MTSDAAPNPSPITICIPVYDDWESLQCLLRELDGAFADAVLRMRLLVLDDGSPTPCPHRIRSMELASFEKLEILRLRRNLGHQRAIAVGLCHLWSQGTPTAALVMDGDGEDAPADAARLASRFRQEGECTAVFAERTRRSERWSFRLGYHLYRFLHWTLTGISVRVGNFSILPWEHLRVLVVTSELWSHYAAAVFKSRLGLRTLDTHRRKRYAGHGKMNLVALVVHGLAAISVFADVVGMRLLFATTFLFLLACGAPLAITGIQLVASVAVPPWALTAIGFCLILAFQALVTTLTLALVILHSRNSTQFIPIRDFWYFIAGDTSR